jgi:cobalt/nickel transport protein
VTEVTKKTQVNKSFVKTMVLVLIIVGLTVLPLLLLKNGKFAGADSEAEKAITEMNPDYKPWVSPLLKPKSSEIESLLFALQAAIGSGVVFYGLGYMRGRKKKKKEELIK